MGAGEPLLNAPECVVEDGGWNHVVSTVDKSYSVVKTVPLKTKMRSWH
jgi:hypothetical protein